MIAQRSDEACNGRSAQGIARLRVPSIRTTRLVFAYILVVIAMVFLAGASCDAFDGKISAVNCEDLKETERTACYVAVLEKNPCDRKAFVSLIWTFSEHGTPEELLETLASLSSIAPDAPHYYQMRSLILAQMGKFDAAEREESRAKGLKRCFLSDEEEMELALPLPPTSENAARILERAQKRYSSLKDYEGAVRDYETYLKIVSQPVNPSVYRNLAGARRQTGDTSGAIQALTLLISVFPEQRESTLGTRAKLYREIGDYPSADKDLADLESLKEQRLELEIAQLSTRIEQNPGDHWAYYERGKKRLKSRDLIGTIEDATEATILAPSFASAYRLRAEAKELSGDLEGAEADRVLASSCKIEE